MDRFIGSKLRPVLTGFWGVMKEVISLMGELNDVTHAIGDRTNPQQNGAGRIYLDDIQVRKPDPVQEPTGVAVE